MNRYAAGEIHFNLMAIVADVQMSLQKKIDELSYWLDNLENEEGYEIGKHMEHINCRAANDCSLLQKFTCFKGASE